MTRLSLASIGLGVAVACGPGSDPPAMTTGSTTTTASSSSPTSSGTTMSGPDTTMGEQDTTATVGTTVGMATVGTTTDEPPADCRTLGCDDPEHWCVIFETVEDTGGADSTTAECLPFLPRCEGLADRELLACVEPMCCMNFGCPWSIDLRGMQLVCHTDPGTICGDSCA